MKDVYDNDPTGGRMGSTCTPEPPSGYFDVGDTIVSPLGTIRTILNVYISSTGRWYAAEDPETGFQFFLSEQTNFKRVEKFPKGTVIMSAGIFYEKGDRDWSRLARISTGKPASAIERGVVVYNPEG